MPPFWVGFSKQRKKPGWRRSSNCVQDAFFQLFPSWPDKKNSREIKFYNFGFMPPFWVGFSKQRKKPGWRRSSNCVQNAFFQLFPSWPDKKNSRGIKFYNFSFMPPFWVGFSKQRKKPGWRRSSNCVQNAFFQLSPSGRSEKRALGSNFTISVSCHYFGWAFPSSGKSRVDEGPPIAFKTRFFNFPHRGEAKKEPWDRILQFRFHATILGGLFQAAEKAGLTKVLQLRSKRVFSTFPIGAKRKKSLGIEFYNFGFMPLFWVGFSKQRKKPGWRRSSNCVQNAFFQLFPSWPDKKNSRGIKFYNFSFMPPFWVGFSKQRKKPGWRRSSNCVQNAFFQLSPSGRSEKRALGSNFTISVSCHYFGWAFPSSGKSRVDEGPPIAFKTRFFNFPHRGEAKKEPWDRILQFRFHATILGGLFQAAEKAGLTKVLQLRSKRVFSTFPIGAKRKKSLGIEFYNFGFMPLFWVGFSKQRKKPGWRRSSNCVQNAFFQLSPSGRSEKTALGSNFTISVSCHHFGWAFPSSGKSRVDEGRPIAFKTRFFNFSHLGQTKKTAVRSNFTISVSCHHFGWAFPSSGKSRVDEGRPIAFKTRFFNFSHLGQTKKTAVRSNFTISVSCHHFGWAFPSSGKSRVDEGRPIAFKTRFFNFSHLGQTKKTAVGSNFTISVSCHHFGWAFRSSGKSRVDEGRPIAFKTRFFNFSHLGQTKKTAVGSNFTISVSCHHFGWAFPSSGKSRVDEGPPIAFKTRFFNFSHLGQTKKTAVGSNFTISVSCHHFGWAFRSSGKSRVDEGRPIAFKTRFFNFSHLGQTKKTAVGSNFTISVSCHHFGWAFPSSGKSRVDEGPPIAFKTRFFNFSHLGQTKKTAVGSNFTISVSCHHFGWAFRSSGKSRVDEGRPIAFKTRFFNFSHLGQTKKTAVGSNFTISVSCHHFGWAFPSSGKSRVDEGPPIAFKTRFFNFPHRGEAKKEPWDRILQFRFHATILGGLFQAAEKAGLTKVLQLRSKRVFSTFPIGAKRKKSLGIEFYNFGFMPLFWVGFSKQRKKPGWRRSSNCVQNAFFQLSPSGRSEKTALVSNFTISVSCHHFGWAFPSRGKSRVDEGRPIAFKTRFSNFSHLGQTKKTAVGSNLTISVSCHHFGWAFASSGRSRVDEGPPIAFKTRFFNFPHRGEAKKQPWDRILQFRFHATILGGLFQAAEKAGLTKVVQLRSRRVFSTFPILARQKKQPWDQILQFRFHATILGGLFQAAEKAGLTKVVQLRSKRVFSTFPILARQKKQPWDQILQFQFHATILGGLFQAAEKAGLTKVLQLRSKRVFSTFPIGAKRKKSLGIEFYNFGFMPLFWVGFSKQRKKPGWRRSSNCVQNAFFQLSPSGRSEKRALGSNFTISVSCHYFGWAFPSSGKSRVDEGPPIAFKTRFFNFSHRGEAKKEPWDRILQFRFHATILGGLFQAAEKAGLTKVLQLRSKRVFSTFPIGEKRKNSLGIEFYNFGFMPPFWVGFSKPRKKPGWRRSSNCVQNAFFQLFPSWPDKKNSGGIKFNNFGFMPPFWVGFCKQRKKPGWRRSSNCVQNAFFQLSPSGRSEKTALGSNFTISVSCHHFGWAFPSSGKSRVDEGRPIAFKTRFFNFSHLGQTKKTAVGSNFTISVSCHHFGWAFPSSGKSRVDEGPPIAFKTRFFNFPHRGEAKKEPWDRILQFRFHATILGGLFQAAEKAGLTKVLQLRSKRVCSTFPIGAKRKNSLGIEFYNFGFMPPFWVGFSKQRKRSRVDEGRPIAFKTRFSNFSHLGQTKKTAVGSNLTISVSCHHFGWAFASSGKSRVDEGPPIAFKTRFFNFPHRGEAKKQPWDQILQFRFHATILGGLFQAAEKAGLTKVVQLRSKRVFPTFPILARQKKQPWDRILQFRFHATILGGLFQAAEKAGLTKVLQLRSRRVFSTFPILARQKKQPWDQILQFRFHATILGGLFQAAEKAGLTKVVQLRSKRVFPTFPILARQKKQPWDRILQFRFHATILGGLFQAAEKAGLTKVLQLRSKRVFSTFPILARQKKQPWDQILQFQFHATILGGLFQAAEKAGLTKVLQLRSKRVFSTFPILARKKKQPWDQILQFRFHATILGGLFQAAEKAGLTKVLQLRSRRVFSTFPILARQKKQPWDQILQFRFHATILGGLFQAAEKAGLTKVVQLRSKRVFSTFPILARQKKQPWDQILQFQFHATILGGLFQAAEKAGLTKVLQLRSKRVFSTFPIGAKRKKSLGIEFYNFGFMPLFWVGFSKQRKKPGWRRSSNCVQNAFFQLSPSGRSEKRALDRILQFRFHATILGGLFQAAEKAGLTKVLQLRSKRVFSTFPIGAKRKKSLGIEFYNFGFMPPFWVGFSKQRKKPGWRRSSNCVQNAFFQLSPSGRSEKTALVSNFTISVSCHHFGWAFPSRGKSRVDEGRPIAFKTRFSNFSHLGQTKKTAVGSNLTISVSCHHFGWAFASSGRSRVDEGPPIAFKTRFFNFPHRGEAKKQPWDRILQFRFHATILGGLLQAAEKAGLTKVLQLRSKRVFSTFPIGRKRKNSLGIEF